LNSKELALTAPKADRTRTRIRSMALKLSEGPATSRFTLEQLAERLDLHYTAIYHYFDCKDDLEAELIEAMCQQRTTLLGNARASAPSGLQALTIFVTSELQESPTDLLVRSPALLTGVYRERAYLALNTSRKQITQLVDCGIRDGSIRDIDSKLAANLISRILNRFRNRREKLIATSKLSIEQMSAQLCGVICSGLVSADASGLDHHNFQPKPFPVAKLLDERGMEVILGSLIRDFNNRGYNGTSIPQVAASLGVSKTFLYKFAPTKEELLYACARQTLDLLGQVRQVAKVMTDDPSTRLLLNLFYMRHLKTNLPGPLLATPNFRSLSKEHERVIWAIFNKWRADLVQHFEESSAQGQLRDVSLAIVLPLTTVLSEVPITCECVEEGYHDEVVQFLLYGLSSEKPRV